MPQAWKLTPGQGVLSVMHTIHITSIYCTWCTTFVNPVPHNDDAYLAVSMADLLSACLGAGRQVITGKEPLCEEDQKEPTALRSSSTCSKHRVSRPIGHREQRRPRKSMKVPSFPCSWLGSTDFRAEALGFCFFEPGNQHRNQLTRR